MKNQIFHHLSHLEVLALNSANNSMLRIYNKHVICQLYNLNIKNDEIACHASSLEKVLKFPESDVFRRMNEKAPEYHRIGCYFAQKQN